MRYGFLTTSLRTLVLIALFLTSLAASADGPTPPAGGVPSASQLQQAHNLGQEIATRHFEAESLGVPPPKDLMRHRLDEYLKEQGSRLSDAEKEVFTEAYWSKYDKKSESFRGGMTEIDPPSLLGPGASTTTNVSGKTATPGPGTLQLTDANGNSYFVDVDANGNYSGTVPEGNFQPVKMTFRSATLKAAWELKDGQWTQIASAAGASGIQRTMTPGAGPAQAAGQQVALLDECKQYALVGSLDRDGGIGVADASGLSFSPLALPVRFSGGVGSFSVRPDRSFAQLVGEGPPPTPTESGHRLADLERYKQQGKDSYGNDLPQDPAQREQKVNEREAKIQTEKGKMDGPPPPLWTPDEQKQMRQAYLERQRYYLEQDLKAAEAKATQAGKTGADLRRDPDVKKARQALLENENEFLRNKFPVRTATPATMTTPSGTTGAMLPATPGSVPASGLAGTGQQVSYVIKGTARMGSGVAIPKGTFATGAMLARHETPEEFVKTGTGDDVDVSATFGGPIVKDRLWIWGAFTGNQEPPPVAEVGTNGDFEFKYNFGTNYDLTKDLKVGLDYQYKTALSAGYNYGCGKSSFQDLSTGTPIPPIGIEDRTQLIKGLKPGANLWQVDDAFVSHGLGHVQDWEPWDAPSATFNPSTWFSYKIAEADVPKFNSFGSMYFSVIGLNFGLNTAPAPAWKPENWPSEHPRGIPTARVSRKGGRP